MAAPFAGLAEETLDAVRVLTGLVYPSFTSEQHVTNVGTTVAEVLLGRTGVCQDFAHVLIGLCRAIGSRPATSAATSSLGSAPVAEQGRAGPLTSHR